MRLTAKILENVVNVNHWNYTTSSHFYQGQQNDLYLQFFDLSTNIRYIPGSVPGASVVFPNIDSTANITITGTQPFVDDKSIWKFSLASTQLPSGGNIQVNLVEGGTTKSFIVKQAIVVNLLNVGSC
jgi:hypothetical protein